MQARSKVTPNKSVFNDVEGYQDYSTGKATSISGIQIDSANPKKFTVKFTKVFCNISTVFGSAPMPEHIFGKYTVDNDIAKNVDDAPENNAPPVASGPFKFKEWRKGDQVILSRNERSSGRALSRSSFSRSSRLDRRCGTTQDGELKHGLVQPGDVADLSNAQNLKLLQVANNGTRTLGWRTNNRTFSFLATQRIRQALSYGHQHRRDRQGRHFGGAPSRCSITRRRVGVGPRRRAERVRLRKAKAKTESSRPLREGRRCFYAGRQTARITM